MSDELAQSETGEEWRTTDSLFVRVYDELKRLAAARLDNEFLNHSLDATALVHEVYLRMAGSSAEPCWQNRAHFFGAAAESMRRILIDAARRRQAVKRSSGLPRQQIDLNQIPILERDEELLAVGDAIDKLAASDPEVAELVKLRYFAGLTIPEAAEVLGVSPRTVDSWWAYGRAWLLTELKSED